MVDDATGPASIQLKAGQYEIADVVNVPAGKVITFDGQGVAQLYRTGYGDALRITRDDRWTAGKIVVKDFWAISGRITCEAAAQIGVLRVERTDFYPGGGYGIDLSTGYSGPSAVRDCNFFGGGIRWVYSPNSAEPHACSQLLIERCQVQAEVKPGPDIHLRGCQMACVRQVVCQATWGGWAPGTDPDATFRTRGILVEAPGPRGGRVEDAWVEIWGAEDPLPVDVRVHNPYKGAAGAYESRDFELTNVSAWGLVVVSADREALNVATVESRGGSEPVGQGPVVVRRWLTSALEKKALDTKSPVWAWR
jgi:hypothetical protein